MRNSQTALLTALGVTVLGIVIVIAILRVSLLGFAPTASANTDRGVATSGESVTATVNLTDFEDILIRNSWVVELTQGDEWRVELTFPEDRGSDSLVEVRDGRLILEGEEGGPNRWRWWGGDAREYRAEIVMPALASLEIAGAANVELDGFEGDNLALTISGAANVESRSGTYDSLNVTISGAANVDLDGVLVTAAHVVMSGASNVELLMNGGELSGNISGLGNLSYSGQVSNESVVVSGLGHVGRD